ncbi:peptide chain release factor N(5)-glutamine methyltransferase [Williamsia sterculiae]|uniref:peptide chain release factor N(5)-glutamine methyltransferase n=1 Tax=Williamsia sterculiae TaxID=1344003 RepID=UPI00190E841C|nr:peptide chain release factor N(5)-glutamine methyltransferase [Williamsia sterculiae]
MRIDEALRAATRILAAAGAQSPRVDAELLLAHVTGVERGRLIALDGLDEVATAAFDELVAARATRVPLQHLTGHAHFGGLELQVGPGVFIPRPETEGLLAWALSTLPDRPDARPAVVDLCSGSGALALSIARERPTAAVIAVELSEHALIWLRRNSTAQRVAGGRSITVVGDDATDPALPQRLDLAGATDLVVANPPYVPLTDDLPPEVLDHDPASALFGGLDGMAVIVPMITVIARLLTDGGRCAVEHDDTTGAAVIDAFRRHGGFVDIEQHLDLVGHDRFVTARRTGSGALAG